MPLQAGTSLAHYAILVLLGAGEMGEVERARDTWLGREVALEVLPEHFAENEERLKRFEREAKTLASLNHPNVAQVLDVDQVGDICFLLELPTPRWATGRVRRHSLTMSPWDPPHNE